MNNILDELLENQDDLLNELNMKNGLKTLAVAGLVGGAALGIGKQFSTPPEQLNKHITTTSAENAQLNKDLDKSGDVETVYKKEFKDEYDVIILAADRNNCSGENLLILFAIRKAENGGPGKEFGIVHPRAWNTDLNTQAGWSAATIVKNRKRWIDSGKKLDFVTFLGNRYCPVGASNDPTGLNRNWINNVKHWMRKLSV